MHQLARMYLADRRAVRPCGLASSIGCSSVERCFGSFDDNDSYMAAAAIHEVRGCGARDEEAERERERNLTAAVRRSSIGLRGLCFLRGRREEEARKKEERRETDAASSQQARDMR